MIEPLKSPYTPKQLINHREDVVRYADQRLQDASGETAHYLASLGKEAYEEIKLSYGKKLADWFRKLRTRDKEGSLADELYNRADFWSMAQDWIGEDMPEGMKWDTPEFAAEYNARCDLMAKWNPFMSKEILTWKRA